MPTYCDPPGPAPLSFGESQAFVPAVGAARIELGDCKWTEGQMSAKVLSDLA